MMRSVLPNGVSIASKAMVPVITKDIRKILAAKVFFPDGPAKGLPGKSGPRNQLALQAEDSSAVYKGPEVNPAG